MLTSEIPVHTVSVNFDVYSTHNEKIFISEEERLMQVSAVSLEPLLFAHIIRGPKGSLEK